MRNGWSIELQVIIDILGFLAVVALVGFLAAMVIGVPTFLVWCGLVKPSDKRAMQINKKLFTTSLVLFLTFDVLVMTRCVLIAAVP